jgi:DNA uptake protein ComE-like DNA-binding protein
MRLTALYFALACALAPGLAFAQSAQPAAKPATPPAAAAKPAPTPAAAPAAKTELLDINSATPAELDALPGIGAARTAGIIKGRPYKGKDELVQKGIIPQNVYDAIKDKIIAKQK